MDREKVKLFKMNDYDWVAAESAEQANEWYKKEFGVSDKEQPLEEVKQVSSTETFLTQIEDLTESDKLMGFEIITSGNEQYARIPFTYILATEKVIDEPFFVGSTEW